MGRVKLFGLMAIPLIITIAPPPWLLIAPIQLEAEQVCVIKDDELTECSGLAVSRTQRDAVWAHNDSGDEPRLFMIDSRGKTRMELRVKVKEIDDWEDMCSFELDGKNWLLVGDTGDNARIRQRRPPRTQLHLMEEPSINKKGIKKVKPVRTIKYKYPNAAHDCEGIAVDRASRKILLITKEVNPLRCSIFSVPLEPKDEKKVHTARLVAEIPVPIVTAFDISSDGRKMLIMTSRIAFVVQRKAGEDWEAAMKNSPLAVQLPRLRQGEAGCFSHNGEALLVSSEGKNPPLWKVPLPATKKKSPARN